MRTETSCRLTPLVALAASLLGCARMLPAPVPMQSLRYPSPTSARCLIVFLPGAGDHADTYEQHGFVQAVRDHGLAADVVAADATIGYYVRGMLLPRLYEDVLAPALAKGYQHVWLVGISMGGMGTLMTARTFPGMASGVLLLGPFLGDAALAREVAAAGGLRRWEPGPVPEQLTEETYQRQVWAYLKDATATGSPSLYLGWGESDRLGAQAEVLAAALPAGSAHHTPGGHDWPPWTKLFDEVLTTSALASECGQGTAAGTPPRPAERTPPGGS
jgi:pimeloyl-ACP methyl ester carboxylesterase